MLNPEFRWLDPELEQVERLTILSGSASAETSNGNSAIANPMDLATTIVRRLATPGIHPEREVQAIIQESGGVPQPGAFLGWPRPLLEALFNRFQNPIVLVLGVFDGDGLWAGCLGGVSRSGLDFLATFRYLWNDEPELASRQTLADLHDICKAAARRFSRPAAGLFIYKSEFQEWQKQNWNLDLLHQFSQQQTAVLQGL